MAVPSKYSNLHLPVKYFLSSYKCYVDGARAVSMLEAELERDRLMLSDWKIHWVAACSLLRTAIALFVHDAKLCVSNELRAEFKARWDQIKTNSKDHPIYWEFLHAERNNILHEYKWSAYSLYLDLEGKPADRSPATLLLLSDQFIATLRILSGRYSGHQAIDVIRDARDWVGSQVLAAINAAGLDPDEERNLATFQIRPPSAPSFLTGHPKRE